jgi:hypothetical protein
MGYMEKSRTVEVRKKQRSLDLLHTMIEVVAKQNEKKEWLILSVWSKPVFGKHHVQGKTQGKGFWAFIKSLITGK